MSVTGNSTERVRQHRNRVRSQECTRLDLTIGTDVADKLKAIARARRIPLWQAAQEAFEDMAARVL